MPSAAKSREFSLDEWIESGTVAQATIELYNDRARVDEIERLVRQRADLLETDDADAVEVIDAAIAKQREAFETSKETWTIRALSRDELKAVMAAHVVPDAPKQPKKDASAATAERHRTKLTAWAQEAEEARAERDLHLISLAVVSVETARGTAKAAGETITAGGALDPDFQPAASVDTLRALRARPGRQGDIPKLLQAATDATQKRRGDAAPFLAARLGDRPELILSLRAARAWGARPMDYLSWSARDRGLAEALLSYEASLCPGCGMPRHHAWDERSEGEYEADSHVCQGCKALAAKSDDKKKPGEHHVVRRVGDDTPRSEP